MDSDSNQPQLGGNDRRQVIDLLCSDMDESSEERCNDKTSNGTQTKMRRSIGSRGNLYLTLSTTSLPQRIPATGYIN